MITAYNIGSIIDKITGGGTTSGLFDQTWAIVLTVILITALIGWLVKGLKASWATITLFITSPFKGIRSFKNWRGKALSNKIEKTTRKVVIEELINRYSNDSVVQNNPKVKFLKGKKEWKAFKGK